MSETITPVSIVDRIAASRQALTADQLAEMLNIGRATIYRMAKSGQIPSFQVGTAVRFCPKAVSKWLKQ